MSSSMMTSLSSTVTASASFTGVPTTLLTQTTTTCLPTAEVPMATNMPKCRTYTPKKMPSHKAISTTEYIRSLCNGTISQNHTHADNSSFGAPIRLMTGSKIPSLCSNLTLIEIPVSFCKYENPRTNSTDESAGKILSCEWVENGTALARERKALNETTNALEVVAIAARLPFEESNSTTVEPGPEHSLVRRDSVSPLTAPSPTAPTDPVGTPAHLDVPTASRAAEATATGVSEASPAPQSVDLMEQSNSTCALLCEDGETNAEPVVIYDGHTRAHNGTHIVSKHTATYCQDCVAHSNVTTTESVADNDEATAFFSVRSFMARIRRGLGLPMGVDRVVVGN